MRAILSILCFTLLTTLPARALTVISDIRQLSECPPHLKLSVTPDTKASGLYRVAVDFEPYEPELYRDRQRVFAVLEVGEGADTRVKARLETRREKARWLCFFRLDRAGLEDGHLTLSTQLFEKDGLATVGGGEIYRIQLKSFLPIPLP